jgi:beta-glucanase (GH16 family)
MKKVAYDISFALLLISPSIAFTEILLDDDFNLNYVDPAKWHRPTWQFDGDGTYVGRTQFRTTQNSPLPETQSGMVIITVETYNPTGSDFYGTDLISNRSFSLDEEIHVTARAKMDATQRGIVGGIFLYGLNSEDSTLHDEIDFELLANIPSQVQTNIYDNGPLDAGDWKLVAFPGGGLITDYHTYEIIWRPTEISWFIDGELVRRETGDVPRGPVNVHLNMWVPDTNWSEAFDGGLQPVSLPESNEVYSMSVDSVTIEGVTTQAPGPNPQEVNIVPILQILLLDAKSDEE